MKALYRSSSLAAVMMMVPLLALARPAGNYEIVPNFFPSQLESKPIGACHGGAAVDRAGNIYVSTDTARGILVFGPDGKFVRNFGPDFVHGLFLTREADGEYLYCARPNFNECQKLKTDGTVVWKLECPMESGKYTDAKKEFHPTNIVSTPDGSIFVADGYGLNWIHKYDKDRKYQMSFGGQGAMPAEEGKFNRCHGLAVDRQGAKPTLIVCNRESGRVERWDTDGHLVKVLARDLRMPAAAIVRGGKIAIAELGGRVTILDREGAIVAQPGDNPDAKQRANYGLEPANWKDAYFNSPHGIALDRAGNVIVSEWSAFGRVSKISYKKEP